MSTSTEPQPAALASQPNCPSLDEKFWKRYSPHREMPLSAITSFGLHFLIIGMLIVLAWLGWLGFRQRGGSTPVEPVRLVIDSDNNLNPQVFPLGGGHGAEAIQAKDANPDEKPDRQDKVDSPRAPLVVPAQSRLPDALQPNADFNPAVQMGNRNNKALFEEIDRTIKDKMKRAGPPEAGPGPGPGPAGPAGTLSQSERRRHRWILQPTWRGDGQEYLRQLNGLGAILAVPADPENKSYKIIRDLSGRRTPELLEEDPSLFQRLWFASSPAPVPPLMAALHLKIRPSHFVAIFPRELEEKMARMEKQEARGVPEDQIEQTNFEIFASRNGYEVRLISVKTKDPQQGNRPETR